MLKEAFGRLVRFRYFLYQLFLFYQIPVTEAGISVGAAAASGAIYALGGAGGGGKNKRMHS